MPDVIELHDLHKSYGSFEAVRGLSLSVPQGSICGFLGKNGAGKTTTVKMLIGALRPDAGEGRIFGLNIGSREDSIRIRERTGFVGEGREFYPYMTVDGMIRFTRSFYPKWRKDLEDKYVRVFALRREQNVTKLSKGMRSKLALLLAFCRGADLLILDEPTDGLDPFAIDEALQAIVSVASEGTTVFFSSHQLAEVEQIADRICIVDSGRVRLEDSLEDLKAGYRRVQIVFEEHAPVLAGSNIASSQQEGRTTSLLVRSSVDQVIEQAQALNGRVVNVAPVTLKEIFFETVRGNAK